MYLDEPKVEFVSFDPEDITTKSAGAAVDVCAPGSTNDEDFPCYGDDDDENPDSPPEP